MKKNSKKQLTLKKFTVTDFNGIDFQPAKGGAGNAWTGGCTDFCTSIFASALNCSAETCTNDCITICSSWCPKQ